QLAGLPLPQLGREEAVAEVGDRQAAAVALDARGPAGVQVVGDGLVLREGRLPAVPGGAFQPAVDALGPPAEVEHPAAHLLLPGAGGVGGEGEVRVRLLGAAGGFPGAALSGRIGHGATSDVRVRWRRPRRSPPAGGNLSVGSIRGSTAKGKPSRAVLW